MANDPGGRRPVHALTSVHRGQMLADPIFAKSKIERSDPERQWGLGIARVTEIDYEEMLVSLQVISGASGTMERVPVPLTFPGAGARHFFGAMPQVGDYCVVGWMPQESSNPTNRFPVILQWVVPGVWPGRDWITTSNFTTDEADMGSKRERDAVKGVLDRTRHKLRHIQPGNVVASSAQGSDITLDEGVLISNRRGNEFGLRDADQAAFLRALQFHQALAGARVYSGMVQRDALFLATTMVSDGFRWDAKNQVNFGEPVADTDLPPDPNNPAGFLTPASPLARGRNADGTLGRATFDLAGNVDPYTFLQQGGYIDSRGFVVDARHRSDAVYGGKPLFRVTAQSDANAVIDPKARTLTEYRIEVTHSSDGRLPVTEQTDMFDSERLPDTDPNTPGSSPNAPYIEWVLGSVIGNDPFTQKGRATYGRPLVARVFDDDTPNPRLEAVDLATPDGVGVATPIEEHAATLFKLDPINGDRSTFWSVNKKGQVRMFIAGPPAEASVEAVLQGGLKLRIGGPLRLVLDDEIALATRSRNSLHLSSEQGPVTIFGGGSIQGPEAVGQRAAGTGRKESDLPAVDIQARTNIRIKATKKVFVKGAVITSEASENRITGHDLVRLTSAKKMELSAEDMGVITTGKRTEDFSGPKNFLPTAGALHDRTYTPNTPGMICEKVNYTWGDRVETFQLGNHTTTILIGNATYNVVQGFISMIAATSSMLMGPAGITGTALAGNVTLSAVSGLATLLGTAGVAVLAPAGLALMRGSLGVMLSGPIFGPDVGPIICAGSLEPFTNLPFLTWGLGAKGHMVIP